MLASVHLDSLGSRKLYPSAAAGEFTGGLGSRKLYPSAGESMQLCILMLLLGVDNAQLCYCAPACNARLPH
jgi:hypothetical protein